MATIYFFHPTERPSAKIRNDFCKYEYALKDRDRNVKVCALEPLTKSKLTVIEHRLQESLRIYPTFASEYGNVTYTLPLQIYVLDVKTLNNRNLFSSKIKGKVVGRYKKGLGDVYITQEIFYNVGYTDLQHELAHYGNDNLGISDSKKLDESLAYDFERYYKRYAK